MKMGNPKMHVAAGGLYKNVLWSVCVCDFLSGEE